MFVTLFTIILIFSIKWRWNNKLLLINRLTWYTAVETPLPFYFEKKILLYLHIKKDNQEKTKSYIERTWERERKIIQCSRYSSGCVDMNQECLWRSGRTSRERKEKKNERGKKAMYVRVVSNKNKRKRIEYSNTFICRRFFEFEIVTQTGLIDKMSKEEKHVSSFTNT
jgi:hypothetical protein